MWEKKKITEKENYYTVKNSTKEAVIDSLKSSQTEGPVVRSCTFTVEGPGSIP